MNLKVLSLNMMHGRNMQNSVFPIYLKRDEVVRNISKITKLIKKMNPDIVALQEVDYNSIFTGDINQLDEISKQTGLKYKFYSANFKLGILTFGTAILSKYPLRNTKSFNFPFAFPTPRKGFAIAEVSIPGKKKLTFASVHMTWINYLRLNHRKKEVSILIKEMKKGNNRMPMIVAGDFNCGFTWKEDNLRLVMNELDLETYEKESDKKFTHPSIQPKVRIDWILASNGLKFLKYKTINEKISDHLPVYAEIKI